MMLLIFFVMMSWNIYKTWSKVKSFFRGNQDNTDQESINETINNSHDMNEHKIFGDDEGEYVEFEEIKEGDD